MVRVHLRWFVSAAVVFLALAATIPWARQAVASRPDVADFAPTYAPREAAARVAAARAALAEYRRSTLPTATAPNQLPLVPTVFFPHTGHHLSNRAGFLDFWRANGQVVVFGYPITEEIVENGRIVQYFERARFEFHPELMGTVDQVQLGLLGREILGERDVAGVPNPQNGALYFPETQHTLSGEFRDYWERRGGVTIFGYPISEEIEENGSIVQYFERTRLEYHPDDMAPFYRSMEQANGISLNTLHEVVVSDLGRQVAQLYGINTEPVAPLAGAREWSPALWNRHIEVSLSEQWLTAYEDDLVVYRAPVATGRDGFNTPTGSFAIYDKLPVQTMTGSAGGESWYVPDVPWVQYVVGGVALHGTYWHNQFGTGYRPSHGCINLSMDDADWLYQWAGIGTTVVVGD
jgi:hypothetical protein